jgi:hypothetical protein
MARPCRHCAALLIGEIVLLVNRYDPPECPAGMVEAFVDNVDRDARPRTAGSEGPAKIMKHPCRYVLRQQCVDALLDGGNIPD